MATLLMSYSISISDSTILKEILTNNIEDNPIHHFFHQGDVFLLDRGFRDANQPGLDFPQLDISELIIYGLGSYQIKHPRSCFGEHIKPDGAYKIAVFKDLNVGDIINYGIQVNNPWLLRGRIQI